MYHRMVQEPQPNPLLPGYTFNAYLVAGLTPILADGPLDFFIDRPGGMKGYILNLTLRVRARFLMVKTPFTVTLVICCSFRLKRHIIMVAHLTVIVGIIAGSISVLGPIGQIGWSGTVKPMK